MVASGDAESAHLAKPRLAPVDRNRALEPTNRRINHHPTAASWGNGRLARWQYRASQSPGSSQPLHLSRTSLSIPPRNQPPRNRMPEPTNRRINRHKTAESYHSNHKYQALLTPIITTCDQPYQSNRTPRAWHFHPQAAALPTDTRICSGHRISSADKAPCPLLSTITCAKPLNVRTLFVPTNGV